MQTKLTLRMEDRLVREAKGQAARRGTSVSRLFSDVVSTMAGDRSPSVLPPLTGALRGVLKGKRVAEEDYRRHLRERHLAGAG